jgi:hypothetical protein
MGPHVTSVVANTWVSVEISVPVRGKVTVLFRVTVDVATTYTVGVMEGGGGGHTVVATSSVVVVLVVVPTLNVISMSVLSVASVVTSVTEKMVVDKETDVDVSVTLVVWVRLVVVKEMEDSVRVVCTVTIVSKVLVKMTIVVPSVPVVLVVVVCDCVLVTTVVVVIGDIYRSRVHDYWSARSLEHMDDGGIRR